MSTGNSQTKFTGSAKVQAKPLKPKQKNRDWLGALTWFVVSLIGLALGRLGILWPSFDIFSQFYIFFAMLLVGSCFGLCLPRLKGLASLALTVLMIATYGLWPLLAKPGQEQALDAGEKRLSVASFNVHLGATSEAKLAKAIQDLNPDIAALIEYEPKKRDALQILKAQYPYQQTCSNCQFAIIAKFPISPSRGSDHFMAANLGPDYGNTEFVVLHTTRFPETKIQAQQFKEFGEVFANQPGQVIFVGDFNSTPFSVLLNRFAQRLDLKLLTSLPSWPANKLLPLLAIDHVLVSPGIRAIDQQIIGNGSGSDHYPIRITLAVNTKIE